ncbi:MAG: phage portal protein [Dehalococcoidia bacterium]
MKWREKLAERIAGRPITSAARAVQADVYPHQTAMGIGNDWTPTVYGDYYATSIPTYSAIKIRGDSMSQVPWVIHRTSGARSGTFPAETTPIGTNHPAQQIFDHPNPDFSGAELRRAVETNLCIWGRAAVSIEPSEDHTRQELWNLRPDRLVTLPGAGRRGPYIKGYLYHGLTGDVAYLPEEIEIFRFYNPLQDRTGLSPIAPYRLSADMGKDALKYNRSTLRNQAVPDYLLLATEEMTDEQANSFYERWEKRFGGPSNASRPAIASNITGVEKLAFSNLDMEFLESLKLTVKDAARIWGVPEVLLSELEFATLANMDALVRLFWQTTILSETNMFAERITSSLLPKLGYPDLELHFDFSKIDALNEGRDQRVKRESDFLDRDVITINEVRATYDLPPVAWGHLPREKPQQNPGFPNPQRREQTYSANGHLEIPSMTR